MEIRPDWIGVQESKISEVDSNIIAQITSSNNVGLFSLLLLIAHEILSTVGVLPIFVNPARSVNPVLLLLKAVGFPKKDLKV